MLEHGDDPFVRIPPAFFFLYDLDREEVRKRHVLLAALQLVLLCRQRPEELRLADEAEGAKLVERDPVRYLLTRETLKEVTGVLVAER